MVETPEPRKGMPSPRLGEAEFKLQFKSQYEDPSFAPLQAELDKIAEAAWQGYFNARKSPVTQKAGPEFRDPAFAKLAESQEQKRTNVARVTLGPCSV